VQGSWFGQRWRDAETQQGEINWNIFFTQWWHYF
jgi:hypothetical protein